MDQLATIGCFFYFRSLVVYYYYIVVVSFIIRLLFSLTRLNEKNVHYIIIAIKSNKNNYRIINVTNEVNMYTNRYLQFAINIFSDLYNLHKSMSMKFQKR